MDISALLGLRAGYQGAPAVTSDRSERHLASKMPTTAARVNPKAGGARPQAGGAARPQAARRPAPKARVRRGSEENAAPNGQYTEGVYANRAAKAPAARKAPVAKPPGFKKIASPAPAPAPTRPKKRVAQAPAPAQRPKPVQAPAPAQRPKPKPIARPVKEAPAPAPP